MSSPSSPTSVRTWYSLRLAVGLAFLIFATWLTYWLLFEYQVRNHFALTAIGLFLALPSIIAILKTPGELLALIAIWRSDDPATLDQFLGDMRERNEL